LASARFRQFSRAQLYGALSFLALAAVFFIVNRAAYKSYFQDDEFDTLSWAQILPGEVYAKAALSPLFSTLNFRPTGAFYFHEAILHFGLDFPRFVLILHLVHLFNVWLIWLVSRKLGARPAPAALACCFFAFHMALFDAFWKPMYIYDVLCATFCLLAIYAFARRWWIASFAAYWLAYKSKEPAVMLPLVLACYEIWFGKRRWQPLVPFFLASLSFGVQGLLLNPNKDNAYTFRFTLDALRKSSVFYAARILLAPYMGFLVPLAAVLARNRRTWFGLALMGSLFFPLLFLPGRLISAYCYAPFTGLALVVAGVAESAGFVPVAVLMLVWLPLNLDALRAARSTTLARAVEVRHWMAGLERFAATRPRFDALAWTGRIPGFADWGASGAVAVAFHASGLKVYHFDGPEPPELAGLNRVYYLVWSRRELTSALRTPRDPGLAYIRMDEAPGTWQLDAGWHDVEGDHRWTSPHAEAHLERPQGAARFAMRMAVYWDQLTKTGPVTVHVRLNGAELAPRRFDHAGDMEAEWDLPPAPAGPVRVTVEAEPLYEREDGAVGVAVRGIGFTAP
jgi:hypothetical protein